jgi:hypothetical protein
MPAKLGPYGARALVTKAYKEMTEGRESTPDIAIRGARYEWDYRGGKKTALKFGVGLTIGAGVVSVGVATHGAGIPVVIGLAAGSLALGVATDTAFAKLWDRDKRGGKKTQNWLQSYTQPKTAWGTKEVEERAHKTVRRAFQHYLTAWLKAQQVIERLVRNPQEIGSCRQGVDEVTEMLSIVHHLEKARLYIHPAVYLSVALLDAYDTFRAYYEYKERIAYQERWHTDMVRCNSNTCYMQDFANTDINFWIPLWKSEQREDIKGKLRSARAKIYLKAESSLVELTDSWSPDPNPVVQNKLRVVKELFRYARDNYDRNIGTKISHGISNDWERKTDKERMIFLAEHTIDLGLRAGTAGLAGGAEALLHGFAPLADLTADMVAQTAEVGLDHIGIDHKNPVNLPEPGVDIQTGASSQESLRNSAVHLFEIYRINTELSDMRIKTCDEMVKACRLIFEIQYHLKKVEKYLDETIERVTMLTDRISQDIDFLLWYNTALADRLKRINHWFCGGLCISRHLFG